MHCLLLLRERRLYPVFDPCVYSGFKREHLQCVGGDEQTYINNQQHIFYREGGSFNRRSYNGMACGRWSTVDSIDSIGKNQVSSEIIYFHL
jgi:hypothetical protein